MKVEFDYSFEKQILKLTDASVKRKIFEVIVKAEQAENFLIYLISKNSVGIKCIIVLN